MFMTLLKLASTNKLFRINGKYKAGCRVFGSDHRIVDQPINDAAVKRDYIH